MSEDRRYFNLAPKLGVLDVTLTLVPAPEAGPAADNYHPALRIHRVTYNPTWPGWESSTIDCGAVNIMNIPIWAFLRRDTGWMEDGILCPVETALICTPSAAGNAGDFFITYSVEG